MPSPATNDEFLDLVRKSGVVDEKRLETYLAKLAATSDVPPEPAKYAGLWVRDGVLTHFQAEQFLQGKWRRFTIGRYKVLERLGQGGMGSVYLCEHKLMRRRVAVKVLPTAKADDPASLERFYREARAVAALDHPNIVRAYDIDQDDKLHFLVMEFVDGANFQEIVKRTGPMDLCRAAHYIRQAALGIQHAHESAGIVHRDIKPGNILVDRNGIVKILDMGLARFFHDTDDVLTKKYDENVLGTADYLAPEQALDSHTVDIRADIYSLGATFYFCLTGRTPFAEGTVAQKLIWHQTRQPKPIRSIRPDVPEAMAAVIEKAMAKDPAQRYQTPMDVAEALAPWTQTPIPPPPDAEMPQLSPAAMGPPGMDSSGRTAVGLDPSGGRKTWQVPNGSPSSAAAPPPSPAPISSTPVINLRKSGPLPVSPPAPAPASGRRRAPAAKDAPRPAPVRPAPATVPRQGSVGAPASEDAVSGAADDEVASWDKLVTDTDDANARADTAPASGRRQAGPASKKNHSGRNLATIQEPVTGRRLWWVLGIAAVVVLTAIGAAVALFFAWSPTPNSVGREPLRVNPAGGPKTYRTIKEAVDHAAINDHIVLMADVAEADVRVTGKVENLVIESDPGRRATWKCPDALPANASARLLTLDHVTGFQLKGVALDGGGKADTLVSLLGTCPGVKLDDLDLKNYAKYGVFLWNCDGDRDRPVLLSNLRFTAAGKSQTAVFFSFQGKDLPKPQYVLTSGEWAFPPEGGKVQTSDAAMLGNVKFPPGITPEVVPAPK